MVLCQRTQLIRRALRLQQSQQINQSWRLQRPFTLLSIRGHVSTARPIGWYGVDNLHNIEDLHSWREEVEKECERLRKSIGSPESRKDGKLLVHLLDTISARMCLVLDTNEVCASSHENSAVRSAAQASNASLLEFVTRLNMDSNLYDPLAALVDSPSLCQHLTAEEKRTAENLKAEFERDGIHLSVQEKQHMERFQAHVRQAEARFAELEHRRDAEIHLSASQSGELLRYAPQLAWHSSMTQTLPPTFVVKADRTTFNGALRMCPNGDLRKMLYLASMSHASATNLDTLAQLVVTRNALAQALGYLSYASLTTSYRMASCPENVIEFLDSVSASIKQRAEEETRLMRDMMWKSEPERAGEPLAAWDVPFYSNQVLSRDYGALLESTHAYFSVDNCIDGLKLICKSLFGLNLEHVPLAHGEAWADNIEKLRLVDADGTPAGTLYLDLFQRKGKYQNPAHFQVQSSHRRRSIARLTSASPCPQKAELDYQLPSSVLVCSFDPSNRRGLAHGEAVTLFHEFGHALHSLLSRTELQHLSGTRGELDFVETPSQLMEYFCFDKRVLKRFAFHRDTGEPIPDQVIDALRGARYRFAATDLQQQVMYAACDQVLFGKDGKSKVESLEAITEELHLLAKKYTEIEHVKGTYWVTKFSHFANYGAAYYSYTYSKCFASDIWHTCFAKDPLSPQAGQAYREKLLRWGGSKDPNQMLRDLLGREPTPATFIQELAAPEQLSVL